METIIIRTVPFSSLVPLVLCPVPAVRGCCLTLFWELIYWLLIYNPHQRSKTWGTLQEDSIKKTSSLAGYGHPLIPSPLRGEGRVRGILNLSAENSSRYLIICHGKGSLGIQPQVEYQKRVRIQPS